MWLCAALQGVGSARQLECVAQDGVCVRAGAGAASFRRKASLEGLEDKLELVRARVRQLKEQIDADPAQDSRRKAAAQQRAQREMQDRLQSAVEWLPELEAIKRHTASKAEEARASSTDSDASVMKMADGGYGPAYNTQYASDFDSQVIAGVQVSTSGSDLTQLAPMVEQLEQRLGSAPQNSSSTVVPPPHAQIEAVADKTEVCATVPEARAKKDDKGNEAQQDSTSPNAMTARRWRAGAQPRPAAHAGTGPAKASVRRTAVRAGAPPHAYAGTGAAMAGPGHNYACSWAAAVVKVGWPDAYT